MYNLIDIDSQFINDDAVKYICSYSKHEIKYLDIMMNPITEIGMLHISLATWNRLNFLNLGKVLLMIAFCGIGDRGCRYLSRANFPVVYRLDISKYLVTQAEMKLVIQGYYIFIRVIGTDFNNYQSAIIR
jgi:hypothetical protein